MQTNDSGKQVNLDEKQLAQWHNERDENIHLTTGSVIQYAEQAFGVAYSCRGMRDLLHREGYVFKKPVLAPGNPDREEQEQFVRYYEDFMMNKEPDVEMLFVDAVHPEHNAMAAYDWIKKGQNERSKQTVAVNDSIYMVPSMLKRWKSLSLSHQRLTVTQRCSC